MMGHGGGGGGGDGGAPQEGELGVGGDFDMLVLHARQLDMTNHPC